MERDRNVEGTDVKRLRRVELGCGGHLLVTLALLTTLGTRRWRRDT